MRSLRDIWMKTPEQTRLRKSALCNAVVSLRSLEQEQLRMIGVTDKHFFAGFTLENVMSIARRDAARGHVEISSLPSFEAAIAQDDIKHEMFSLVPVPEDLTGLVVMSQAEVRAQILSSTWAAEPADEAASGTPHPSPFAEVFEIQHLSQLD